MRKIRKVSNRKPEVKAKYQYVTKKFASNLNEKDFLSYIASMVDKNIIVNNPTLKDDSYFIIVDSKNQQGDEVSNNDQHELFQQTRFGIDCNTPEKAVLSNSSGSIQESVSENLTHFKIENLVLKFSVIDEFYMINVNLNRIRAEHCDQTKYIATK